MIKGIRKNCGYRIRNSYFLQGSVIKIVTVFFIRIITYIGRLIIFLYITVAGYFPVTQDTIHIIYIKGLPGICGRIRSVGIVVIISTTFCIIVIRRRRSVTAGIRCIRPAGILGFILCGTAADGSYRISGSAVGNRGWEHKLRNVLYIFTFYSVSVILTRMYIGGICSIRLKVPGISGAVRTYFIAVGPCNIGTGTHGETCCRGIVCQLIGTAV